MPEVSSEEKRKADEVALTAKRKADEAALAARKAKVRRPVVAAFGSVADNRVLAVVNSEALKRQVPAVVFALPPLTSDRMRTIKKRWPLLTFSENERVRSVSDAMAVLSKLGFDAAYLIVSQDQMVHPAQLQRLARQMKFKQFGVVPVLTELFAGKKTNVHGQAFVLYAFTKTDARALREAFEHKVRCVRVPLHDFTGPRCRHLMEHGEPFYIDASGAPLASLGAVHRLLERVGYNISIYTKELPLTKTLTEQWVQAAATYGQLRERYARDLIVLSHDAHPDEMVEHVWATLYEGGAGAPKAPSEVDQLIQTQKQQDLLLKRRQSDEVLAAKERELEKKAGDANAKAATTTS